MRFVSLLLVVALLLLAAPVQAQCRCEPACKCAAPCDCYIKPVRPAIYINGVIVPARPPVIVLAPVPATTPIIVIQPRFIHCPSCSGRRHR